MPRSVLLVALTAFLYMLGLSVIFPVVPKFVRDLQLSELDAGVLVSSYTFASFLFAPLWGSFSERYGRRPTLLIGLVGFAAAFVAFGASSDFYALLSARILGGMVAAAVLPSIFAYVADAVPAEQQTRAMGLVGAGIGMGVLAGVGLGGGLGTIDLRYPFYATGAVGLCAAVAVALWVSESLTPERRAAAGRRRSELAERGVTRSRVLVGLAPFWIFSFLIQSGRSGLEITIGFLVLDRFAGGVGQTGIVLAVGTLAGVLMQGGGVRSLERRFADQRLLLAGALLLGLGLFGVGVASGFGGLLGAAVVLGLGAGLVEPTFRAQLARAATSVQGEAQGIHASTQSLARSVAFFAFPALYGLFRPELVFGIAAVLCLLGYAVARGGLERPESESTEGADALMASGVRVHHPGPPAE